MTAVPKRNQPIPMSPGGGKAPRSSSPGAKPRSVSPGAASRSPGATGPNSYFSPPPQPLSDGSPGANGMGPSENCFPGFRSYVKVRPYKGKEGSTKPPDQIVPRPALDYNGKTLTVLDPKTFKGPLKTLRVNTFDGPENVIWCFVDPLETEIERKAAEAAGTRLIPQAQADVYHRVVEPLWPSILEGYGSAFVVMGGPETGKTTTMFGDEKWSDENKGIFPRFVEEVFDRFKNNIRGDTTLKFEVSCVEIPIAAREEKYIDLLHKKADVTLRVADTENEGLILEGSARMECETPQDMLDCVRRAVRPLRARKTSNYAITIHVCLTTTYKNLENPNAPPKILSRRVAVSFSVMRSVFTNATFARCIDNAVDRDNGSNARAKPPTRDSCWTKLFADIFLQKLNVTTIMCASPYYEHAKENGSAFEMAKKLSEIKTAPILRADESEVEYRRLADEIHNLDNEVTNTNQNIDFIQTEIDKCHNEYESASNANAEAFSDCQQSKTASKAYTAGKARAVAKGHKAIAAEAAVVTKLDKEIAGLKEETKATLDATEGIRGDRQAADDRIAKVQSEIDKQTAANALYETELNMFVKEEEAVKEKEDFIVNASADYEETKLGLVKQTIELKGEAPALKEEVRKAETALASQKQEEDTFAADLAAQRKRKAASEAKKAELEKIKADLARTLKEAEQIEAENERKAREEEEKANRLKEQNKCCTVQ